MHKCFHKGTPIVTCRQIKPYNKISIISVKLELAMKQVEFKVGLKLHN